jgi:hypothetical protein
VAAARDVGGSRRKRTLPAQDKLKMMRREIIAGLLISFPASTLKFGSVAISASYLNLSRPSSRHNPLPARLHSVTIGGVFPPGKSAHRSENQGDLKAFRITLGLPLCRHPIRSDEKHRRVATLEE